MEYHESGRKLGCWILNCLVQSSPLAGCCGHFMSYNLHMQVLQCSVLKFKYKCNVQKTSPIRLHFNSRFSVSKKVFILYFHQLSSEKDAAFKEERWIFISIYIFLTKKIPRVCWRTMGGSNYGTMVMGYKRWLFEFGSWEVKISKLDFLEIILAWQPMLW